MPSAIIELPQDIDDKVRMLNIECHHRSKKETLEYIIQEFFNNRVMQYKMIVDTQTSQIDKEEKI